MANINFVLPTDRWSVRGWHKLGTATHIGMGNIQGHTDIHSLGLECRKLEILRRVRDFPVTLREAIDGFKDDDPETFLLVVEERLVDLLYGIGGNGLDWERDTVQEVETAIRFFPHVLCEKYWGTHPPIYAQLAYCKSVPFIPLLAKLGIELQQFQAEERGGLFYYKWNVLRSLVNDDFRDWYDEDDEEQRRLVDETYATAIQSLNETGIIQRQDIAEQDLVGELSTHKVFPEQRFRCLVDIEPNSFYNNQLYRFWPEQNNARVFRIIFELGMLHFPTQLSFLFHTEDRLHNNGGSTPFREVCRMYGTEKVTKIIGDVVSKRNLQILESGGKPIDMEETLINAVTNPNIHLDGVYFLLRRDPGRYFQASASRDPKKT